MKKLLLVILLISFSGCQNQTEADDVLTIGLIAPLSGEQAAFGNNCLAAAQLAVSEINAEGERVRLLVADDRSDVIEGVNAFYRLTAKQADAVIGGVTSAVAVGLSAAANNTKTVLLSPSATADSVDERDDYMFRACFTDSFQGRAAARFIYTAGFRHVAVLYAAGDAYSAGLKDAFIDECLTLGLAVSCVTAAASAAETDYGPQLLRIAKDAPEVLYAPLYYGTVGPYVLPQARALGYKGIILGGDGYDGIQNYVADKKLLENVLFSNHYAKDLATPTAALFTKNFSDTYGEEKIGSFAALGYDAVYMLYRAFCTQLPLREALKNLSFSGVTGEFAMDESGTPKKGIYFIGFQNGAEITVYKGE